MRTKSARWHDEQGMILFSSLAILSILLMVGIGSRVMLQNDYRALANLRGATAAFYISTAGLEWGKNEIFLATEFPPKPDDRSADFAAGTFFVNFLSPTVTSPLSARVVVRSTGVVESSSHTVQARLAKTYDLADSAIGLRGNGAQINLSGGAVFISGRDHDLITGKPLAASKSRSALSGGSESLRALIDQASGSLPQGSLESGGNTPVISSGEYLPTAAISQLAASLCAQTTAILSAVPSSGTLMFENQTWGGRATPELRCIEGLTEAADAVTLAGNVTGAGILIVRNADLILSGSFRWEGLILVTGSDVSLKITGPANKEVFGAAMINEIGYSPAKAMLDVQGNMRVVFSRRAFKEIATLIPESILKNYYAHLPAFIQQDYWRTVTP